MAKSDRRKTATADGRGPSGKPPAPRRGGTNPALARQARKVMGKHYAAKYGVRKERG